MKKLLAILGAISITASSTATIACTTVNDYKASIERQIKNYIEISSIKAQSAILNDKDGKNFSLDYTSGHFKSQKVADVLGKDFIEVPMGETQDTTTMERLFSQMFGDEDYRVNANDFENKDSDFIKSMAESTDTTITGDSSILKTLSLVSAAASVLLGSNFNSGISATIEGAIVTDLVANALKGIVTPSLIETVEGLSTDTSTIGLIINGIREGFNNSDIKEFSGTLNDLFNERSIVNIIGALVGELITGGNIMDALMSMLPDIIKYVRTLVYYINQFDTYKGQLDIYDIVDPTKIFSKTKTNEQVVEEVLRRDFDYEAYTKISLQDLFSTLQMLLSPEKKDRKGYNFQKLLVMLFAQPKAEGINNPVIGGILAALESILGLVGQSGADLLNTILEALGLDPNSLEPWIKELILDLLKGGTSAIVEAIENIFYDIANQGNKSKGLLNTIATILKLIPSKPVKAIANYLLSPVGQNALDNLYLAIFDGDFILDILKALKDGGVNINNSVITGFARLNSKGLRGLLTTPLADVLAIFGLNIVDSATFLYGLKWTSLSDIMDSAALQFETNRDTPSKDNTKYKFDTDHIVNLLDALVGETSTTIKWVDGTTPPSDFPTNESLPKTLLGQILMTLGYEKQLVLEDNGTEIKELKSTYLLGMRKVNGKNIFKEGSLFGVLGNMYGNYYDQTTGVNSAKPEEAKTMQKVIDGLLRVVTWLDNKSMAVYVKDTFSDALNQKNWTTRHISNTDIHDAHKDAVIKYELIFNNNDTKAKEKYDVTIKRYAVNPGQDPVATWKITDITKK
ncbi:MOLPALP family lipoprotein [[Acholeplasma] multilocale]|uniref:MOLPALP family lipoprotein n=1 Tax=[Acholeplasma] multilocale TaxID=264638 RepID=UPI00047C545B|nr:MOLPALP family lipoprotein [[Acholeplasma] multilocale]